MASHGESTSGGRPGETSPRFATPGDHTSLLRLRWRRMFVLVILLALAVHTLLPQLATLEAATAVLRRMRWWAVALAIVTQSVSYWGNGATIRSVARLTGDRLGMMEAIGLALAAGSIGLLTGGPVGYGAATYHWTRGRGMSHVGAVVCGWLPGILNAAVMIALAAIGVVYLLFHHVLGRTQLDTLGILGALVAAIIVAGGWVLARQERVARVLRAWGRLRRRHPNPGDMAGAAERFMTTRQLMRSGGWRRPVLGAVVNAGFDAATLFCLFIAARQGVVPGVLLAGYALPQVVGRLTFLPGGLGVVEGGMVGLYALLGVPATAGVLVVLAYRTLSFWLPNLIGFPLAALFQRSAGRADRTGGRSPSPRGANPAPEER